MMTLRERFEKEFKWVDKSVQPMFLSIKYIHWLENKVEELEAVKNRVCEWEERNDCIQAVNQYKPKCFPEIFATRISDYCPYCGGKIEIKE